MLFDKPLSLTDALRFESLKKVLALSDSIGSRDIQDFIPTHIREMSFFSARTPFVTYLGDTQKMIQGILQPEVHVGPDSDRDHLVPAAPGESLSPAQVRAKMKQHLAALDYQPDPDKRGGLQDLSSDRRINLIIDTQLSMARGQGQWRQNQDSDIMAVWPADELYRAIKPKGNPRDWQEIWNEARDSLAVTSATEATDEHGPFVALKNDDIWTAISDFGLSYPPFKYNSGMRVKPVGRRRAIALEVLGPDDEVIPRMDPLNQPQSVSLQESRSDIASALQEAFGSRASLQDNQLFILPDPLATLKELIFRSRASETSTGAFAFMTPAQQQQLSAVIGEPAKPGVTFAVDSSAIASLPESHVLALPKTVAQAQISGTPLVAQFTAPDGSIVSGAYDTIRNRFVITQIQRRGTEVK